MSTSHPTFAAARTDPERTLSTARLLAVWSVLLGGLVGFWLLRPYFDARTWNNGQFLVLFATSKLATWLALSSAERRALPWRRLVAYLVWPGMQPRLFLPDRWPSAADIVPTLRGTALNLLAGVACFWLLPALLPEQTPRWIRVWLGLIGFGFLFLFVLMDAWVHFYRRLGIAVEKLWVNPLAATSLLDFWGRRWNRIYSGMLREVLFLPLARRVGVLGALFAVYLYGGLLHENLSVAASSGYGGPLLYFFLQFVGVSLESTRFARRLLQGRPVAGWLWTVVTVVGPAPLLLHAGYIDRVFVPSLVETGRAGSVTPLP